jgi:hypothetical protein
MSQALFTTAARKELVAADIFGDAERIKTSKVEDQFEIGECQITCRYRTKRGDFVCQQCLGCWNAIRAGQLRCKQKKVAIDRVLQAKTVIGIVGPDDEAKQLALSLAEQFTGIVVTVKEAIVAG